MEKGVDQKGLEGVLSGGTSCICPGGLLGGDRVLNVWQGGRDVLRLYGYTEERPDGLSFPEGQEEPDEYQVAIVTLEVLLLRTELSLLLQVRWPSEPKVLKY